MSGELPLDPYRLAPGDRGTAWYSVFGAAASLANDIERLLQERLYHWQARLWTLAIREGTDG